MVTRNLTRTLLKEISGLPQFDTGHTLEIRRDNGSNISTATEISDGNYTFTWTAENSYGYFYVDGVIKTVWGHVWLGEVVGYVNLDGAFEIDAPLTVNGTINVSGSTTLSTSLTGLIRAASGVISAGQLIADSDISSTAAIAWTKVSKVGSNLTDLITRDHSALTSIGTNTHAQIDTHIAGSGSAVHGAVSTATANQIVTRDAAGRASFGDLSASASAFYGPMLVRGATWSGPGDAGTLYLGDTSNYVRMNWGGNMVLFANGQTYGIQLKLLHDWLGIGGDPTTALDVFGSAWIRGAFSGSGTGIFTGALTTGGALNVSGTASISGSLGVSSSASFASTIAVLGVTTLSSSAHVVGAVTLDSTLAVTGAGAFGSVVSMSSTLQALGTIYGVSISGSGNLNIAGNTFLTGTLNVSGNATLNGNITLADSKYIRNTFSAYGFTGTGFTLEHDVSSSGLSYLEVDNMTIRHSLRAYELLINEIKATNGSVWISDAAKVQSVASGSAYVIFETVVSGSTVMPFAINDIVMCQMWQNDTSHTVIKFARAYISQVGALGNDATVVYFVGSDLFAAGDNVVRVGNLSNSARQGAIYMTADDIGNPYIDILNGVSTIGSISGSGSIKARLGNLAGIADTINGISASGYGLYSQNAFLKGGIVATFGKIGNWTISADSINSTTIYGPTSGSSSNIGIYAAGASSFFGPGVGALMAAIRMWNYRPGSSANSQVVFGQMLSGSTWISASGFAVWPDYGSTPAFIMSFPDGGGTPDMRIAGWQFDTATLSSSGSTGGGNAIPTSAGIIINSAGWISGKNFALGTTSGSIAGWGFNATTLHGGAVNGSGLVEVYASTSASANSNWYQVGSYLNGFGVKWWTAYNAGQIVMGRMMGDGVMAFKTHPSSSGSVYGIQMMDFRGNEFFALGADATTASYNGQDTLSYCRIAGWGFDFNQFSSSGNVGGSDGAFTTSGIAMNKLGWISAPAFALGTSTSKIAGWGFNTTTLSNSATRIEASTSLRGMGVQVGGIDRVLIGSFSMSAATDTSIDSTATFLVNGGLSGSGGVITGWTISNLAPWTCFSGSAAAVWSSPGSSGQLSQSMSTAGLAGKTMLLTFTVHSYTGGGTDATNPIIYLDIPGAYWQRTQYLLTVPAVGGSYMFSAFVTFFSDFTGVTPAINFYGQTNGANDKKVVIGPISLKSYPDTFIFANETGINIYKSPAEQISVINGVFTVKSPYIEVQGVQSFVNQSMVMFGNKYRMYYSNAGGLMMEENRAGVWTLTAYINDGQNGWLHP